MRVIIDKWLNRIEDGERSVDHAELASDRGFLVYLSQAYPALAPYMKGIHLTLESWQGGWDAEGWKLGKGDTTPNSRPMEDSHSTISEDTPGEGLGDLLEDLRESELRQVNGVSDDATMMTEARARLPSKHKLDSAGRTSIVP